MSGGSKFVGDLGESLACEYLVNNGYKILCRNYRIDFGEIDIIAKKKGLFADKTIHFIEVKTLSASGLFSPEEHVDYKKQRKLRQLSEIWMAKNKKSQNYPYQIDVVSVCGDKIDFFENIISA